MQGHGRLPRRPAAGSAGLAHAGCGEPARPRARQRRDARLRARPRVAVPAAVGQPAGPLQPAARGFRHPRHPAPRRPPVRCRSTRALAVPAASGGVPPCSRASACGLPGNMPRAARQGRSCIPCRAHGRPSLSRTAGRVHRPAPRNGIGEAVAWRAVAAVIYDAPRRLAGRVGQARGMVATCLAFDGTTAVGIKAATAAGFAQSLRAALEAAVTKARQMGA